MELKGGKLLDKIRSLQGSINLINYRGNLRQVAVECGYIRKDRIQTKEINDEKDSISGKLLNLPYHL